MRVRRNNFLSHAEDWGLFRLARISWIPGSPIAGAAQGFGGWRQRSGTARKICFLSTLCSLIPLVDGSNVGKSFVFMEGLKNLIDLLSGRLR
jgi:hypothetical protein